ncbi:hypothetical protein HETIRDRAFT_441161 [Heterobasidion irregulare TC 32-1]|uniref:Uncharacterized protein n=1 Tax=Heterobasidion irregulare (strain TC 32-1) TaxID=747525 RepID=W4JZS8_HETIT|nr:uncharacterized protein HETIRDRAFT_441161 [Heterobasidion irregulare TC 32-1]ETW79052.1 hypothetical protein HETIRDRAFT_441161 [Heterobasidion irregulare TC 32-1]
MMLLVFCHEGCLICWPLFTHVIYCAFLVDERLCLVNACARSIAAVYIFPMAAYNRFSLSMDLIHLGGLAITVILWALPRNRIGAVKIAVGRDVCGFGDEHRTWDQPTGLGESIRGHSTRLRRRV